MNSPDLVSALKAKHAALEEAIEEYVHRPCPDSTVLAEMKRKKLRIKDEIARLVES